MTALTAAEAQDRMTFWWPGLAARVIGSELAPPVEQEMIDWELAVQGVQGDPRLMRAVRNRMEIDRVCNEVCPAPGSILWWARIVEYLQVLDDETRDRVHEQAQGILDTRMPRRPEEGTDA